MIVELVNERTNEECGELIEAILKKSGKINQAEKEEETETYSMLEMREMMQSDQETNINRLMRERVGILKRKMGEKKVEYTVDLKETKSYFMSRLADRLIEQKYSLEHKRVIKILQQQPFKENVIGEKGIMTMREVRNILMDLFKDGFIIRKVTGNETIYHLSDEINMKIENMMYQMVYNLKERQNMLHEELNKMVLTDIQLQNEFNQKKQTILKLEEMINRMQNNLLICNDF